jgi:ribulose-5-phosphate 4-epimerase/fuculose-1-phosphate aldolase
MKAGPAAFDEVTAGDVILADVEGQSLAGAHRRPLEYPLQTELLGLRPDINSVVRVHPPHAIAPVPQDSGYTRSRRSGPVHGGHPALHA